MEFHRKQWVSKCSWSNRTALSSNNFTSFLNDSIHSLKFACPFWRLPYIFQLRAQGANRSLPSALHPVLCRTFVHKGTQKWKCNTNTLWTFPIQPIVYRTLRLSSPFNCDDISPLQKLTCNPATGNAFLIDAKKVQARNMLCFEIKMSERSSVHNMASPLQVPEYYFNRFDIPMCRLSRLSTVNEEYTPSRNSHSSTLYFSESVGTSTRECIPKARQTYNISSGVNCQYFGPALFSNLIHNFPVFSTRC